jgi:predicted nuclease of predicted toxin-antitoxin system
MNNIKLLLDEHYTGLKEYLEALGWNVTTIRDVGLNGASDRTVIEYARDNDFLVVTGDDKPSEMAKLIGVNYIWVSPGVIAKAIDKEINEKYHDVL